MLGNEPVTVELYVEGDFIKYVNNDGQIGHPIPGKKMLHEKAEALTHFSMKKVTGDYCWLICRVVVMNCMTLK